MVKSYPKKDPVLRGKLTAIARQMRHEPTLAEDHLWQRLRGRHAGGLKFHRQFRIDRFVVDFYCASAALIVEVDGVIHNQQLEKDQERDHILAKLGFRVIRFSNTQVLEQTEQVLQAILSVIPDR